jgi:hypothetical protein
MYQSQIAFRKEMELVNYLNDMNHELEYLDLNIIPEENYVGTTKKKYILIGT